MNTNQTQDDRAINAMLGDVEIFRAANGPNGPWTYRSLTVRRFWNTLRVYDVDGQLVRTISIGDLDDAANEDLRDRLDTIHTETLSAL